ncbi:MAG TPA: type II toxin-antitoxin system VapC family toxin [Gammaproteobacteria bacterium]|nr:type II toxin-antitoxin system VapC family toxin [Gammaproteobacteria bacterium]
MRIICDTNVLIFWADRPGRLTPRVRRILDTKDANRRLAIADITLWEIAMLFGKGRLNRSAGVTGSEYMGQIIDALRLELLPITPEIAELSQSTIFRHNDPEDRLIAATAIHHNAPLVTSDKRLRALKGLETIW